MTPTVMTVEQVAARWQCSGQTVRNMIAANRLPALRLGRIYRIPIAAVKQVEDEACQIDQRSELGGSKAGSSSAGGPPTESGAVIVWMPPR
jgi:excisionase family DNA binding protein